MPKYATGIDVGTHSVRVLQGYNKKGVFTLNAFAASVRGDADAEDGLADALETAKPKSAGARIGVTGRDAMFRYLQIPDTGDAQLRKFVDFEIAELSDQSGGDIVGGFNLLHPPSLSEEVTVAIALTKGSQLEDVARQLKISKVRATGYSPNGVALFNAWLKTDPEGKETVLLASIGEENVDVAIANGTDMYFARNLSGGTKFFMDAIQQNFRTPKAECQQILEAYCDLDPARRGKYATSKHGKVSQAMLSPAGQLSSLLQSAQMFARTQAKIAELKVDRMLICGGGARIQGLCEYLSSVTGMSVEIFDPFDEVDLSELSDEVFEEIEANRLEAVVALGHALADSDPKLYQLEIVPLSLERRRNLLQRTSFLVGASVIALAFLIFAYDRAAESRGILERFSKVHRAKSNALLAADKTATAALTDFQMLWERSDRMQPWLEAAPALLSAVETVQSVLPEDFTIERVRLLRKKKEGRGAGEGRPVVQVAIHYMQRGGDFARDKRNFYETGLLAPGRFTPTQCRVVEGAALSSEMRRAALVLEIDPFAPIREAAPVEEPQDEENF